MITKFKFKELENSVDHKIPFGGSLMHNPDYRTEPIEEVIRRARLHSDWVPFGYTVFYLVRSTGTIHAFTN